MKNLENRKIEQTKLKTIKGGTLVYTEDPKPTTSPQGAGEVIK
ncbi:hypothetical protein CLU97_1571 [Chryseobacterium sp. 7]|nr:hypothetical protein [Chryseobacterium sp. 7]RLJ32126.1 hypothetical protein CLU97_1571 [Chryseobacterium sp. 7]